MENIVKFNNNSINKIFSQLKNIIALLDKNIQDIKKTMKK